MEKKRIKAIEQNITEETNVKELLDQFKFVSKTKPAKKSFKGLAELGERLRRNQKKD